MKLYGDGRDTDSRSGLWLLLLIVAVGSALQIAAMPSTGSAAPSAMTQTGARAGQVPSEGGADFMSEPYSRPVTPMRHQAAAPRRAPDREPSRPAPGRVTTRAPRRQTAEASTPAGAMATPPAAAEAQAHEPPAAEPAPPEPAAAAGSDGKGATGGAPIIVLAHAPSAPRETAAAQDETADPAEPETPPVVDDVAAGAADRGRSHDPEPGDARIVVVGPAAVRPRGFVTFTLVAENVKGLAHAPVRLAFDAEVLEFVSGEEGGFLASDGAQTRFMIAPGETPGTLDIALSRMASAGGIDGSGVLCSVTFLARGPGMSPIVTAGSRFLDAAARGMTLRSDDAYVSVQ